MTAFRKRLHDDQQGVTLIELLVVTILVGIIGGMILTTLLAVQRVTTTTEQRLITIDDARIAANTMQRRLRGAFRPTTTDPLLEEGGDQAVQFLTIVPGQAEPNRIRIYVDPATNEISQDTQRANVDSGPTTSNAADTDGVWNFGDFDVVTRPLLANVDAGAALFAYYDLGSCPDGDPEDPACVPLPFTDGDISVAGRNTVDLIEVTIAAQGGNAVNTPLVLTSRILLRNNTYNLTGS